jgi:hypothetical protein
VSAFTPSCPALNVHGVSLITYRPGVLQQPTVLRMYSSFLTEVSNDIGRGQEMLHKAEVLIASCTEVVQLHITLPVLCIVFLFVSKLMDCNCLNSSLMHTHDRNLLTSFSLWHARFGIQELEVSNRKSIRLSAKEKEKTDQNKEADLLDDDSACLTITHLGEITQVNGGVVKFLGYSRSELLGSNVRMIVPEPFSSQHGTVKKTIFLGFLWKSSSFVGKNVHLRRCSCFFIAMLRL